MHIFTFGMLCALQCVLFHLNPQLFAKSKQKYLLYSERVHKHAISKDELCLSDM